MYKTILFDFDGTLCASLAQVHRCLQQTFAHFGYPEPSLSDVAKMCQRAPDLLTSFFILDPSLRTLDNTTLQHWQDFYRTTAATRSHNESPLYPGVPELLAQLNQRQIECAIVSNKHTNSITKSLQEFGLMHYFTNIYGSDGTHPPKPNAEIFTLDIHPSRPQLALSDFLMVGDTETDYWFAHHAGIDIAWVDYGYGNPDFAQQHPINYRLKTPIDLLKFV